jgi:hypothetical protein
VGFDINQIREHGVFFGLTPGPSPFSPTKNVPGYFEVEGTPLFQWHDL